MHSLIPTHAGAKRAHEVIPYPCRMLPLLRSGRAHETILVMALVSALELEQASTPRWLVVVIVDAQFVSLALHVLFMIWSPQLGLERHTIELPQSCCTPPERLQHTNCTPLAPLLHSSCAPSAHHPHSSCTHAGLFQHSCNSCKCAGQLFAVCAWLLSLASLMALVAGRGLGAGAGVGVRWRRDGNQCGHWSWCKSCVVATELGLYSAAFLLRACCTPAPLQHRPAILQHSSCTRAVTLLHSCSTSSALLHGSSFSLERTASRARVRARRKAVAPPRGHAAH